MYLVHSSLLVYSTMYYVQVLHIHRTLYIVRVLCTLYLVLCTSMYVWCRPTVTDTVSFRLQNWLEPRYSLLSGPAQPRGRSATPHRHHLQGPRLTRLGLQKERE